MPSYIHPLDFPQPWEKPSFSSLLSCLQTLKLDPPTWGSNAKSTTSSSTSAYSQPPNRAQHRQQVTSYLTLLISSPLIWIHSDEEKELIWEEASRRLSERCGRSGMGEMTRHWVFSHQPHVSSSSSSITTVQGLGLATNIPREFTLAIREPPLTGDHLGLKTWCSSYVMAQKLPEFRQTHLTHLFPPPSTPHSGPINLKSHVNGTDSGYTSSGDVDRSPVPVPIPVPTPAPSSPSPPTAPPCRPITILELGSGTGLLGLASSIFLSPADIILSDLATPEIMENLRHNVLVNAAVIDSCLPIPSSVSCTSLVWGTDSLPLPQQPQDPTSHGRPDSHITATATTTSSTNTRKFDLILVADPLCDTNHPSLLASCIDIHLPSSLSSSFASSSAARSIVMVPLRDDTTRKLLAAFRLEMATRESPLVCAEEGIVKGQDDWQDYDGEGSSEDEGGDGDGAMRRRGGGVECWWGVFRRGY